MVVTTLKHGRIVFSRLAGLMDARKQRDVSLDTETQPAVGYGRDDALIYGRPRIRIWSLCYRGESYSFPTDLISPEYPNMSEWASLLRPLFADGTITKVFHNFKYDANVFYVDAGLGEIHNRWCTMTAAWCASEWEEKGLKSRAHALGRILRETRTVDFSNLEELAAYAEADVVATDELYQMQVYGKIFRSQVYAIAEDLKKVKVLREVPLGLFVAPHQHLNSFQRTWFELVEMPVVISALRAERRGFPFDVVGLRSVRKEVMNDLAKAMRAVYRLAGFEINIGSGAQLEHAFKKLGINNPFLTKSKRMCFDAKALKQLENAHPFVKAVGDVKTLQKLISVYIGSTDLKRSKYSLFPDCGLEYFVNPHDGCIHCTLSTVGAVTGRSSSSNPNLQQIPARKDRYSLRNLFTAVPRVPWLLPTRPKPRKLVVLDYSQLELRVMALACRDSNMIKVLSDPKGDMHTNTAEKLKIPRDPDAKQVNFLMQYGGKAYALAQQMNFMGIAVTEARVEQYRVMYDSTYPRVSEFRKELVSFCETNGYVFLFTGRRRHLPDAEWNSKSGRHRAETTLSNNVIQGAGQDFLKAAIVRCDPYNINPDQFLAEHASAKLPKEHVLILRDYTARLQRYRFRLKLAKAQFILQVHDEAIILCEPSAAEEVLNIWATVMAWRHYFPAIGPYSVPLVVEGGVGDTWKAAKSKDKADCHVKSGFEEWQRYAV